MYINHNSFLINRLRWRKYYSLNAYVVYIYYIFVQYEMMMSDDFIYNAHSCKNATITYKHYNNTLLNVCEIINDENYPSSQHM